MVKKCKPLNCNRFTSLFNRFYEKVPVDMFVVKCRFRNKQNECTNEKETLRKRLIM